MRLLSLVALAAAVAVVVVRAQPPAHVTPIAQDHAPARAASDWLAASVGRTDVRAPLTRRVSDLRVKLGGAGVAVRSASTKLAVSTIDAGAVGPWKRHANGIVRPTAFGRETITVTPTSTEIFLHVDRPQGERVWSWSLGTGVRPRMIPGGAVLLAGAKPLEIKPVKIYDAARNDVTPAGARWQLTPLGKSWRLDLHLDDARLPSPYVIDPEITSHPSYRTIVTNDGAALTPLDDGGPSLVQNIPSNSSHGFNGSTDKIGPSGPATAPPVIEVWFSTTSGNEMPFWSNRSAALTSGDLYFGMAGGQVFAWGDGAVSLFSGGSYADGQPHQAVLDLTGGGHLYVDGVERASGGAGAFGVSQPAYIGYDIANDEYFSGNLDEYATYGSLSAAQVLAHYQAGTDSTPPTLTVTGQDGNSAPIADGTRTSSDTASFTYTAGGDAVGTPECSTDGGAFAACPASPVALSGLSGTGSVTGDAHTFAVRVSDSVGNTRTVEIDWTVDRSAPTARVAATVDRTAATTTYVLSSNDAAGTFQCSIDGAAAAPCTSPVVVTGTSHTIAVTATDDVGNAQTAPPVSPPSLTSATVPPARTKDTFFNFTFTAAGGSTVQCQTDGAGLGACTTGSTYAVSGLSGAGQTGTAHTVDVKASDAGGFNSTTQHFGWTVDTTAPTVTLDSTPTNPGNTATFAFHSNETQPGSVVRCSLDTPNPPTAACTSPQTFTPSEASHTARFLPVDDVGNVGAQVDYTWVYDATNPTLAFTNTDPVAGSRVAATTANFTFSPTDGSGIASVECRTLPAAFGPCTTATSYDLSGLSSTSPHGDVVTVEVKATDNASNSTTISRSWTVDTTPPTTTVTQVTNTGAGTTQFTFSANEPGVTFACQFNGAGGFAPCTSPVNRTSTTDTIAVKGTDDLGNAETTAKSPPSLSIDTGPPAVTASQTADFTFTAGGTSSDCKLDGGSFSTCASPLHLTGVAEGSRVLTVRTTDAAGNSTSRTRSWTVDLTGPAISIISKPSSTTTSTSATFQFNASDGAAGVDAATFQCHVDLAAPASCNGGSVSYSGLGLGAHTFHVTVDDLVGNHSTDTTYTWTIVSPSSTGATVVGTTTGDRTPPSAPRDFAGSLRADGLHLQWAPAIDNSGRIAKYFIWVDGTQTQTVDGAILQTLIGAFSPDDHRVFKINASDPTGNVGPFAPALTGVPNVIGQQLEAARNAILARGFSVGDVTQQAAPEPPGTVISQAPTSPGVAQVGSSIDLVVSQQGGQAQLVMDVTAAHRVLLAQRNFIAVRVALSLPAGVKGTLTDRRGRTVATWKRTLPAGATIVRLTLPKAVRHTGVFQLRVDASGSGQSAHRTLPISLVAPAKATVKPIKPKRFQVVLVNGPDLRPDIALGLNQSFTLQYVDGQKAFDAAEGSTDSSQTVAVALVDVTGTNVGVIRDLHLVFPMLRIIAVSDSSSTGAAAHASGASLVFTKPVAPAVLAAAIQSLSRR